MSSARDPFQTFFIGIGTISGSVLTTLIVQKIISTESRLILYVSALFGVICGYTIGNGICEIYNIAKSYESLTPGHECNKCGHVTSKDTKENKN